MLAVTRHLSAPVRERLADLEYLQRIGGDAVQFCAGARAVGCSSCPLDQSGNTFDTADLKDLLQWREIDPQVQRRGANHTSQLASF